jgi:hypothetical protein
MCEHSPATAEPAQALSTTAVRRRLANLAFNLAAAPSLLLCVATAALWVRS